MEMCFIYTMWYISNLPIFRWVFLPSILNNTYSLFTSINKAKFRKPIYPDNIVSFEVSYLNRVKEVYKFNGIAKVNNVVMTESEFSAMVTFNKNL